VSGRAHPWCQRAEEEQHQQAADQG
jgi:hypothetical protein